MVEASAAPLVHPSHFRAPIGSACRTVASIPARYFRHKTCCVPGSGSSSAIAIGNSMSGPHPSIFPAPTAADHADASARRPVSGYHPSNELALATLTRHVPPACHVQMQKCNGNHRTWKCRREPDCFSICYATSSRIGLSQPNLTRISCLPAWRLSRSILCNAIYCANFHGH